MIINRPTLTRGLVFGRGRLRRYIWRGQTDSSSTTGARGIISDVERDNDSEYFGSLQLSEACDNSDRSAAPESIGPYPRGLRTAKLAKQEEMRTEAARLLAGYAKRKSDTLW